MSTNPAVKERLAKLEGENLELLVKAGRLAARVVELEEATDLAADALLSDEYLHRARLGAMLHRVSKGEMAPSVSVVATCSCGSKGTCPACQEPGMMPLGLDRTEEYVRQVQTEAPGWNEAQQLAEVMKRSKGAANPGRACELLQRASAERSFLQARRVCSNCGDAGHWYSECAAMKAKQRSSDAEISADPLYAPREVCGEETPEGRCPLPYPHPRPTNPTICPTCEGSGNLTLRPKHLGPACEHTSEAWTLTCTVCNPQPCVNCSLPLPAGGMCAKCVNGIVQADRAQRTKTSPGRGHPECGHPRDRRKEIDGGGIDLAYWCGECGALDSGSGWVAPTAAPPGLPFLHTAKETGDGEREVHDRVGQHHGPDGEARVPREVGEPFPRIDERALPRRVQGDGQAQGQGTVEELPEPGRVGDARTGRPDRRAGGTPLTTPRESEAALANMGDRCEIHGAPKAGTGFEYVSLSVAMAEAINHMLREFGDEYEGRLGPVREAVDAFEAFLMRVDTARSATAPSIDTSTCAHDAMKKVKP